MQYFIKNSNHKINATNENHLLKLCCYDYTSKHARVLQHALRCNKIYKNDNRNAIDLFMLYFYKATMMPII